MKQEYRCKAPKEDWDDDNTPWRPLPQGHRFSYNLDYQFRSAPSFIPGYFLYEGDENAGTRAVDHVSIHWFDRDPGAGYNRVNVTLAAE